MTTPEAQGDADLIAKVRAEYGELAAVFAYDAIQEEARASVAITQADDAAGIGSQRIHRVVGTLHILSADEGLIEVNGLEAEVDVSLKLRVRSLHETYVLAEVTSRPDGAWALVGIEPGSEVSREEEDE